MSETSVPPTDRAVEQALVTLKKGAHLLKYGPRGKPKFCPFRLSTDEKFLIWYSGQDEKQLRLSSITKIVRGQRTETFQRLLRPESESQSFSIVYGSEQHSLDLICKDKAQADSWCLGLKAMISRSHNHRSLGALKTRRGAQSCIGSPAGYMRRKHNLGLAQTTTEMSQVRSLAGSPTKSISERCFSDGLSCSDSFYSESSLPSHLKTPYLPASHSYFPKRFEGGRRTENGGSISHIFVPSPRFKESDDLRTRGAVCANTEIQENILGGLDVSTHGSLLTEKSALRDVLIWGEGIEGGYLGGGTGKFDARDGPHCDALLPKLLESTATLDVQKLSLGGKHAALVTKQGEVFCWGEGTRGRLGNKVNMDATSPNIVDALSGISVKSVVCGEYQTCALTFSGELFAWGDLVGEDSYKRSLWHPQRIFDPFYGVSVSHIACGEWHMAILSTTGQLFTYGEGTFGVLGHGNLQSTSKPKEVESLKGVVVKSVACGPWHTAAIVETTVDRYRSNGRAGKLFTWGDGDKGRLGHADQESKLFPTCVAQLVDHDFVQVSCGRMLTIALTCMGKVYTMGSAIHGQLGNPHSKDKSIALVQGMLKNEFVRDVSCGAYHIAVLTSSGSVYTWGKGSNGQLGLGHRDDRNIPTLVEALSERQVESITCGPGSSAAICLHKSISSTDQSACRGCGMAFGFTRKKHNCYNCGLLFCNGCSTKKAMNAALALQKSKFFRVCDPCFTNLKRTGDSENLPKLGNLSPRLLLTYPDENVNRTETKNFSNQPIMSRKYGNDDTQPQERYHPDTSSALPLWGQVSCPSVFKYRNGEYTEKIKSRPSNDLCTSPAYSKRMVAAPKCLSLALMNVEEDFVVSDSILTKEIQKLKAEAEELEKLFLVRSEKIEECKQHIEETWSLAKEEAAKAKAAKDVIKVLTTKLHSMCERLHEGRESNDQVSANLSRIASVLAESPDIKDGNAPESRPVECKRADSMSSSPIFFASKQNSMPWGEFHHGGSLVLAEEEEVAGRMDPRFKECNFTSEWVEKYEPGVYITFMSLPSGQKSLKRVRFSRKKFTEKEAERWWEEHEVDVYHKYDLERRLSSSLDETIR